MLEPDVQTLMSENEALKTQVMITAVNEIHNPYGFFAIYPVHIG